MNETPKGLRINWKNNFLFSLDNSLAYVIRDALIAFKNMDRAAVTYSEGEITWKDGEEDRSNWVDKSEWFLDELIWTFNTISLGGVTGLPEIEALIHEVFGGIDLSKPDYINESLDKAHAHPSYQKMRELEDAAQARVNAGLKLFADNFERLWD